MAAKDAVGAWSATQAGTDSGATVTQAAIADKVHVIMGFGGYTDTDATITLKSGDTVLGVWKVDVSVEGNTIKVTNGHWPCARGEAASCVLSASTAACQINVWGITTP